MQNSNTCSVKKKKRSGVQRKENFWGFLFIAPNLIGFVIFTIGPVLFALLASFTDWNLLKGIDKAKFVGIKNFTDMAGDKYLAAAMKNNLILLLVIPVSLFVAMVLAVLIDRKVYWKAGARALFFLPYITNMVSVSTIWQALYHPTKGPINMILQSLGVAAENLPGWLASSEWALLAAMIVLFWKGLGYNILMYSASLQAIPSELYEAAVVDGANSVQSFFKITIPMLSPQTFLLMTLGIIDSLQMWSFMHILTEGGPGTATYTMGLYIYRSAFSTYRTGYASALSWVLCGFVLIVTLIQWRGQKKWVNY